MIKKHVAQLFDNVAEEEGAVKEQVAREESIQQVAKRVAFEQLRLTKEDVLLDVGTGTGNMPIAATCISRQVIGIDIGKKSLKKAKIKAEQKKLDNAVFAYCSFEEPCAEINLASYGITKILAVYSLHHLPDQLKKESLVTLVNLLHRPGHIVICDIMFFDDPDKYRNWFDEVGSDGGDADFPSRVEYLTECLNKMKAKIHIEQIHPLVGVIRADFT
jgi:ubiquinone/menaquinone biosynthesis C-methylase UbiE